MPRLPRRSKRRWSGYNQWHREHLETGFCIPGTFGFDDADSLAWGWLDLRADIMRRWVADQPGTRPWGWWKFDAPELRQRIDGGVHPFDDPAWHSLVADQEAKYPHGLNLRELRFGILNIHPQQVPGLANAKYESQQAYLSRLNLMTPEELARCPA